MPTNPDCNLAAQTRRSPRRVSGARMLPFAFVAALTAVFAIASAVPDAVAQAAKGKARGEAGAEAGGLQRRVEQLEEQLVDMQVTIGTLETLARSGGGGSGRVSGAGAGFGPSEAARMEGMETQIRALTAEVQRLAQQVRGGSYDRGAAGQPSSHAAQPSRPVTENLPSAFGSTTVTTGGDPIGSLIDGQAAARPIAGSGQDTQVAALPPVSGGNAKGDYETAYAHLLRQDYGAAEAAFEEFLQRYPSDALAGNAQYWLGETHFVRGAYKSAASAFLKGYQTYGRSNKAPDSLLKLAMSLDRLGQKDAACSSFSELLSRFPEAADHVKSRAATERKRLACR